LLFLPYKRFRVNILDRGYAVTDQSKLPELITEIRAKREVLERNESITKFIFVSTASVILYAVMEMLFEINGFMEGTTAAIDEDISGLLPMAFWSVLIVVVFKAQQFFHKNHVVKLSIELYALNKKRYAIENGTN
jgi:hypothetical protein